jgi:hypothetical protein
MNPMDASIRVRLDYDPVSSAGFIGLWNFDKPQGAFPARTPVGAGGHYFPPGNEYSLSQLSYNPVNGTAEVYISGERENADIKTLAGVEGLGKPDERIRATLSVRRDGVLTEAAYDEVKYIVTQPDSFFYHLQTRPELRNALAARGIYYHRSDMPKFSLRLLPPPELVAALGVQPNTADLLGPEWGHNVAGLNAGLYQDYITGERQYVLAFAGTDDAVWANEWDDWINNVEQAFGFAAPQYFAAMRIGDSLVNNSAIPAGHLVVTGQSLGGGLASAASVAGAIPGDTFNAAGLHRATLYARDPNGEPIPNGMGDFIPIYAGSLAQYDNAALWITARYIDFDILTNVQVSTPIPDAIGESVELDGPYDLEMAGNVLAFSSGILTGNAWTTIYGTLDGVVTMIQAHDHPAILYGLLVDEGILSNEDLLGYDF